MGRVGSFFNKNLCDRAFHPTEHRYTRDGARAAYYVS